MKQVVCSVYDSKAEAFMQPFFCVSRGVAVRMFMDAASDEGHEFAKHAADYTLFELGEFDQVTGRFEQHDVFVNLGLALQMQQPEAKPMLKEVK